MQPTGQQSRSSSEATDWLAAQRAADQAQRDALLDPVGRSPEVLGINIRAMMLAKNNGYPVDMFHENMAPRQAMNAKDESALAQHGYRRQWTAKEYPKALFRRNMAAKFEPRFDPATGIQTNISFVEERAVRTEKEERELRAMKPAKGQSLWFETLGEIPDIEDGPAEDPQVTIARLQGELAGRDEAKVKKAN